MNDPRKGPGSIMTEFDFEELIPEQQEEYLVSTLVKLKDFPQEQQEEYLPSIMGLARLLKKKQEEIDKCESEECKKAIIDANNLRNQIRSLCQDASTKEAEARYIHNDGLLREAEALALLWLAAYVCDNVWPIGFIIAIGLVIAAGVLFGVGEYLFSLARDKNNEAKYLRGKALEKMKIFTLHADTVMNVCEESCWPDLNVPTCP